MMKGVILSLLLAVACAQDINSTSAADLALQPPAEAPPVQYIVVYKSSRKAAAVNAARATGATVKAEIDGANAIAIQFDAPQQSASTARRRDSDNIKALKQLVNVTVEVDPPRYLMRNVLATAGTCAHQPPIPTLGVPGNNVKPYGVSMVQGDQVTYNKANRKRICIIDTGLDVSHPDICSAANPCEGRVTFTEGTSAALNPRQDLGQGHGTHVAGTIAALANDVGVEGVGGSGMDLHIVKVFDSRGVFLYASQLVGAALDCVSDGGASIISMSLGGPANSTFELQQFTKLFSAGVLIVAAAGNSGQGDLQYPAAYRPVLSVAAVDEASAHASFSTFNNRVDVAAPGEAILSTLPRGNACKLTTSDAEDIRCIVVATGSKAAPVFTPPEGLTAQVIDCGSDCFDLRRATGKVCFVQYKYFVSTMANICKLKGGVGLIVWADGAHDAGEFQEFAVQAIPVVTISKCEGERLLSALQLGPLTVTMTTSALDPRHSYAYLSASAGTSMATPHVSAVAALAWSNAAAGTTARGVSRALKASAKDLGAVGRDDKFGFGLVQAQAAIAFLQQPVQAQLAFVDSVE